MNQTKQEAAEAIFQEQISGYPESNRGDMMYGFDYGFQAGTEAAELKWIPVTERLPEEKGMYFVHGKKAWEDSARLHVTRFVPGDKLNLPGFIGVGDPLAWCPIPDSLLNFKP